VNIKDKHEYDKGLSSKLLFEAKEGRVTSLQIKRGHVLNDHRSRVPALLICIEGTVIYEDEKNHSKTLLKGDFQEIEAMLLHRVSALSDSQLLLIK